MTTKLLCVQDGVSVEQACSLFNTLCISDYVLNIQSRETGGYIAVLKVPDAKVPDVWRKLGRDPSLCPTLHLMKA